MQESGLAGAFQPNHPRAQRERERMRRRTRRSPQMTSARFVPRGTASSPGPGLPSAQAPQAGGHVPSPGAGGAPAAAAAARAAAYWPSLTGLPGATRLGQPGRHPPPAGRARPPARAGHMLRRGRRRRLTCFQLPFPFKLASSLARGPGRSCHRPAGWPGTATFTRHQPLWQERALDEANRARAVLAAVLRSGAYPGACRHIQGDLRYHDDAGQRPDTHARTLPCDTGAVTEPERASVTAHGARAAGSSILNIASSQRNDANGRGASADALAQGRSPSKLPRASREATARTIHETFCNNRQRNKPRKNKRCPFKLGPLAPHE